jgi:hypothetical protein
MENEKIIYSLQNEFHMLRHFEGISDELREQLLISGKTQESIDHELAEPGSRFYSNFAPDITTLLQRLFSDVYVEELGGNGNIALKGEANTSAFPNGIGTLSVVSLESIPIEHRDRIYYQVNRGVALKHIKVDKLPSTRLYSIITRPIEAKRQFITAFPGPPAMPLPVNTMEKSLFESCKTFWDSHVFLVKK